VIDQWNWEKSDENTPVVPTLIRDGSDGRFCQLYQGGLTDQLQPGSGCLGIFVRNVSIDHGISDWQTSGIGKSMVDLKNWQKIDRKPPVVPTFIKDGNGGRFSQLYQVGSADQQLPGSSCFRSSVRHAGTGLEASDRQICEIYKRAMKIHLLSQRL
jgi:hypothetical protein